MKYYSYDEPDENGNNRTITKSSQEIIDEYYDYWLQKLYDKYLDKGFVEENFGIQDCIDDWIDLHWARESE